MKVALLLECGRKGSDEQVYSYLINKFCPNMKIQAFPLGNKTNLIEQCDEVCETLVQSGFDKALIIWDLSPSFPDKRAKLDCVSEVAHVRKKLTQRNIPEDFYKLICVEYELESYIVADGRGLTAYRQSLTTHKMPAFTDRKRKHDQKGPKYVIWNYWGDYNETLHALKLFELLPDFNRVYARNPSFKRFKDTIMTWC
jgi:hypothetical protein